MKFFYRTNLKIYRYLILLKVIQVKLFMSHNFMSKIAEHLLPNSTSQVSHVLLDYVLLGETSNRASRSKFLTFRISLSVLIPSYQIKNIKIKLRIIYNILHIWNVMQQF